MTEKSIDSAKLENWDYLNNVNSGIFVINREFRILKANRHSVSVLGNIAKNIQPEDTCYKVLFGRTSKCDDCPLGAETNQDHFEKSFILDLGGAGIYLKATIVPDNEVIFLTFRDNINEFFLHEEIESIKSELVAKNILLGRYRSGAAGNNELIQLINNLPDALVTVDNSMNIRMVNSKAKLEFPAINVRKCYELLGNSKPCKSCPIENKMSESQDLKTSHVIDGKFFTEIINGFKDDESGLLLFRDNTRQIDLIDRIKNQNETINRKNEILSCLVKLEAKMQEEKEIKSTLEYFIDLFLPLYQSESIVLIVSDIRAGSVWLSMGRGVNEEKVDMLTQAYFSRDIHTINPNAIPEEALPWPDTLQINLLGRTDKLVGMIFIQGKGAVDGAEIMDLFKDPLAAYLHNQILIRLLEEKADTDPLTGLYNRRFLKKVMEEEKFKFEKYDIKHSAVVIDVNGLKYVNDRYGHDAGDNMINIVAQNLKNTIRETDFVARTGGDEFLILLTNTDEYGAGVFLDRLNNTVFNELYMNLNDKQQHMVTISTGVASTDTCPPDELIKRADKLMYENKKEFYKNKPGTYGKNKIEALQDDGYNNRDLTLE